MNLTAHPPIAALAARLAEGQVFALPAAVSHARRGALAHAFRSRADFILLAPETARPPRLLSRNRFNLTSFYDADHGGTRGLGSGATWAWAQFADIGLGRRPGRVLALLTQPRFLGYWFNPVSFWLLLEGDGLRAVIAEVNNTFGQRHSYLLVPSDLAMIHAKTPLTAQKIFHVSPFQDVAGTYHFSFALSASRIAIRICHRDGAAGVDTAMTGCWRRLTTGLILKTALARPGGALRVIGQIYWHALRLKLKGAAYRKLPAPPHKEIS